MSGDQDQEQSYNIFAEDPHDEHPYEDNHNAISYAKYVADTEGTVAPDISNIVHDTTLGNATAEASAPPALPPVTNLYNAAQTVVGVMPHAQMLLQAAAGGSGGGMHQQQQQQERQQQRQQHDTVHETTAAAAGSIMNNLQYAVGNLNQQRNNTLTRHQPMNIFAAAEDAYAQHIADLHAENQFNTANTTANPPTVAAAANTAAADGRKDNNAASNVPSTRRTLPRVQPTVNNNSGRKEDPDAIPSKWMGKYNELKRYKQTHGDCSVSQNAKENKQLSAWVRTQKRQYQLMQEGKHSHMSQARADLLDELDFEWVGVKRDQFWKDRYNELVQFNAKNGHIKVPEKYLPAPKLQSWLHAQRRLLKLKKEGKKTALTEDRVKLLAAVGVDEEKKNSTATWMERFNQLKGKIVS